MSANFSGINFRRGAFDEPLNVPPLLRGSIFVRNGCLTIRGRTVNYISSTHDECCKNGCVAGHIKNGSVGSSANNQQTPPNASQWPDPKPVKRSERRACCTPSGCKVRTKTQCNAQKGKWHQTAQSCAANLCIAAITLPKTKAGDPVHIDVRHCRKLLGAWHWGDRLYTFEPSGELKISPDFNPGKWSCISLSGAPRATIETGSVSAAVRVIPHGGQDLLCPESEQFSPDKCARRGKATISVVTASYGLERCKTYKPPKGKKNTVSKGNATKYIKGQCDGKTRCAYIVDWRKIGDPAFGCRKDYRVEWKCNPGGNKKRPIVLCAEGCEAGYNSTITLTCP